MAKVATLKVTLLEAELLGVTEAHVEFFPSHLVIRDNVAVASVQIHQQLIKPMQQLQAAAQQAGFSLAIASGFRGFARQLSIWDRKCTAHAPLLDEYGIPMDILCLSDYEKLEHILRWSALPGASRHHWGSECDIYDAAAIGPDYQLQLTPDEYQGNGPFAPMMHWLEKYLQQAEAPAFYRPYDKNHNGVAPEPWHLSYRPLAEHYEQHFSLSVLKRWLEVNNMKQKETVFEHLDEIYRRFICLPDSLYKTIA